MKCVIVFGLFGAAFGVPFELRALGLGKNAFRGPSEETGKRLADLDQAVFESENPEEMGEYVEGDILFPNQRNGLISESYRWEDGIIPYELAGSFNSKELETISNAMDAYHQYTCIRFQPKSPADTDYIRITNDNTGCWSSVGKIGGKQEVNLQTPACLYKIGTVIHELMHAVGFMHEQNRHDRDGHVDIVWNNILPNRDLNFKQMKADMVDGFGVSYDYNSVMHYSDHAFSRNGGATIIAKKNTKNIKMGQREGFSQGDIRKIRTMYKCKDRDEDVTRKPNGNPFVALISSFFG